MTDKNGSHGENLHVLLGALSDAEIQQLRDAERRKNSKV
jgi:hypothetical protein